MGQVERIMYDFFYWLSLKAAATTSSSNISFGSLYNRKTPGRIPSLTCVIRWWNNSTLVGTGTLGSVETACSSGCSVLVTASTALDAMLAWPVTVACSPMASRNDVRYAFLPGFDASSFLASAAWSALKARSLVTSCINTLTTWSGNCWYIFW